MKVKKRQEWMDLARSIAIMCVIITHACEDLYYTEVLNSKMTVSLQSWIFQNTLY